MHIRLATLMLNESKTLPALAAGCKPFIDSAYIVDDDASTDNSRDTALHLFSEFCNVKVISGTFKNKSEKWNAVLRGARKMGNPSDYLLITNSDEPPELLAPLPVLDRPFYKLTVRHDQTDFLGAYLVAASFPCEYQGRVHETLVPLIDVEAMHLPHILIHRSGSSATLDDREKQLAMLREDFAKDPSARTAFYIGMTLSTLGRNDEAFVQFLRRAGMVGYGDETFYSLFMAGLMIVEVDWKTAENMYKRAIAYNSTRPEPYYAMARMYNILGMHKEAKKWAERGLRLPKGQIFLFHNRWIEQEGLALELKTACENL